MAGRIAKRAKMGLRNNYYCIHDTTELNRFLAEKCAELGATFIVNN